MKLISAAVLVMLALLAVLPVGAHANQGVFATWWKVNESEDDGFGFGFRSKIQIVPLVSFDTRVSWIKFKDSELSVYPIEATGMFKLGMLYAGVGAGYYFFDAASGGPDVDNNFGWFALGGIDIGAGPVGIFGEVKWTSLSTNVNFGSIVPDAGSLPTSLDADGIGFNLGVMFGGIPAM